MLTLKKAKEMLKKSGLRGAELDAAARRAQQVREDRDKKRYKNLDPLTQKPAYIDNLKEKIENKIHVAWPYRTPPPAADGQAVILKSRFLFARQR